MQQKEVLIIVGLVLVGLFVFNTKTRVTQEQTPITGNSYYPCYNPCIDIAKRMNRIEPSYGPEDRYQASSCHNPSGSDCGTCRVVVFLEGNSKSYHYDCYRSTGGRWYNLFW